MAARALAVESHVFGALNSGFSGARLPWHGHGVLRALVALYRRHARGFRPPFRRGISLALAALRFFMPSAPASVSFFQLAALRQVRGITPSGAAIVVGGN